MGEYYNEERNSLANVKDLPVGKLANRVVLEDNDKVCVSYFEFAPGDNTGWHKHAFDYCTLYLTDAKLFHTRYDGTQFLSEHQAREFKNHPVGTEHNVRNESDHVIRLLEVEYKS
ncbi:MAG: cupin [Betaproteobacteria bacterium]|jgi:quercetin dioxygenase-like cupin family protein